MIAGDRVRVVVRAGSIVLFLLLLSAGCGLFDLRDPEKPTDTEVDYDTPTEPRIALRNLRVTTEAQFIGNFQRALTSDYVFRFDPFDAGADTTWTLDRDLQALTRLFENEAQAVHLTWAVRDSGILGDDFYYRNLGYLLVFRQSATDSVFFGGRCTLYFREVGAEWLVYRWADLRDTTAELTWGYARLNPSIGP